MTLNSLLKNITPVSKEGAEKTYAHLDHIAKPLRSLGILEDQLARLGAMGALKKKYRPCVTVMCADNGVVCEGVTQTGSDVTALVASNMTRGQSTVCIMAKTIGVQVFPYDCGMLTKVPGVKDIKLMSGTKNMFVEPAMEYDTAVEMILRGADIVSELSKKGYDLFATGEMGIGNTTTSAAITAVLTGHTPMEVTGKGAGLSDVGLKRKIEVIEKAIKIHQPKKEDPIDVLAKVGGLDIATMTGVFLGCAYHKIPVIIDGFISSVAALVAASLCPDSVGYMIPSHLSKEPGAKYVYEKLGILPPLSMGMALGEGTGAISLIPLIHMATAVYYEMPTFSNIGMEDYKPQ